jgi:hypothetical protein
MAHLEALTMTSAVLTGKAVALNVGNRLADAGRFVHG